MTEGPLVVNAYLTGGKLSLLRRESDGQLKTWSQPAEYSLFVKKENADKIKSLKGKRVMKVEGDYIRVICNDYDEREKLCKGYKDGKIWKSGFFQQMGVDTYEADLSPIKRFLIDSKCRIQKPISGYLDLEADSRVPFAEKERARILCWGLVIKRESGIERFGGVLEEDTDEAERELLQDLFYELCNVDQILAWNGDKYDFEVIKARIEYLGLKINIKRWLLCDHMLLFSKYNMTASESGDEKTSKALNRVAQALKVEGKLTEKGVGDLEGIQVGGAMAYQFWASGGRNRELLLEYCVEDAATMVRIEEKSGCVDILAAVAEACGTFPDSRGMNGMNFVEAFLMRLCAERGMRAPTKYGYKEDGEQFKGAYVFPTKRGLFKDVHVCDFARMYPSIMQAWNMSPDTYMGRSTESNLEDAIRKLENNVSVCPGTLEMFRIDGRRGLFAEALDKIVDLRKYWSKKKSNYKPDSQEWDFCNRRDQAFKIIANTFYGVSGSPMSRFFMREVSESVTQIGVWLIKETEKAAENWRKPLKIIFGDTDSLGVIGCSKDEFEEFVDTCNRTTYPSAIIPTKGDYKFISIAFEKSFSLMVNVEKKTYCNTPNAPILMSDMTLKPLGDIVVGDEIVGWKDGERKVHNVNRRLCKSKVLDVIRRKADIVKVTFESGATITCTPDHLWKSGHARTSSNSKSEFVIPKVGRPIERLFNIPRDISVEDKIEAAWLGGIYDGEGSLSGKTRSQVIITQSFLINKNVCDRIEQTLDKLKIPWNIWSKRSDGCQRYAIVGGFQSHLEFINWCKPIKYNKIADGWFRALFWKKDKIVSIEPAGESEVIALTTESGNYIAWGLASKNCGRLSHFKGALATETTEPVIKGLEYKRGDSAKLARELQELVVKTILLHGKPIPKEYPLTYKDLIPIIEEWQKKILDGKINFRDAVIAKQIKKSIESYNNTTENGTVITPPPHVQVAKILEARGEAIYPGVKIEYIVTDGKSSPQKLKPASDATVEDLDLFHLWESVTYPAAQRVLEAAFPGYNWESFGSVRPLKGVLPGQMGFDFGQRRSLPPRKK